MKTELKKLPKSQVELTIEVPYEEMGHCLEETAEAMSKASPLAGFRPGKAPYEMLKKRFGEMKILEAALDRIVGHTFFDTVKEHKLETVGQPQINVEKMAPGNPLVYKAVVALLPKIKMANWRSLKIKRQTKNIGEKEADEVLQNLRHMQAKETPVDRPSQKSDKVMIDMEIFLDKAPVDGGQAKGHAVYLNENYYIPGLPEKLLDLKKGDTREFSLSFPTEHYQKHLAGKLADFKVTVKDVFERVLPELTDELAKNVGQKNLTELRQTVINNMKLEAEQKEEQRVEIELIEGLIKQSEFDELPDSLIAGEKQKMFAELKAGLAERGISFEDYLKNLKKTEGEMAKDFEKNATERAKTALLMRELAKEEKITATEEEHNKEIKRIRELYKDNPNLEDRLNAPEINAYIDNMLVNRKIIEMIKKEIVD